ncbi:MAG: type II toxin-antitoxin system RelE/ParE family toxin [Betaproteobacteria bacterium]|nr:MAG: type II toxin-antitoxin system RelE/ParE family toxin [Betaproteobacteria bacterium]
MRSTRPVSWLTPARKAFEAFPDGAREIMMDALSVAGMAGIAKPMKGLGSGVFEVALPYRGNAFRVVYAVQLGDELWVVHAFQKKSTHGIKTPKHEIDLIKDRLKRLKEMLR